MIDWLNSDPLTEIFLLKEKNRIDEIQRGIESNVASRHGI